MQANRRGDPTIYCLWVKSIFIIIYGVTDLTLLKILMRTRKRVTSMAILPGTTSGLTRKLTQLTITNMALGR